jgi:hypothetical protein
MTNPKPDPSTDRPHWLTYAAAVWVAAALVAWVTTWGDGHALSLLCLFVGLLAATMCTAAAAVIRELRDMSGRR